MGVGATLTWDKKRRGRGEGGNAIRYWFSIPILKIKSLTPGEKKGCAHGSPIDAHFFSAFKVCV